MRVLIPETLGPLFFLNQVIGYLIYGSFGDPMFVAWQVIDLTERDKRCERETEGESEICRQQRERESFLQQQRDLMMRHTLQVSEGEFRRLF